MTSAIRGYYCLVQYCPDPGRLEAANLGVLLFAPDAPFLDARLEAGNDRVRKFFGRSGFDNWALNSAKQALRARLQADREHFRTLEDLQRSIDSRANELILSAPRPVKVTDPEQNLDELFRDLVARRPQPDRPKGVLAELDQFFQRLLKEGRGLLDLPVKVPLLGKTLKIPYAYRNGEVNLLKPTRFSPAEAAATDGAVKLSIEGDLLQRYGQDEMGKKRLIVVSSSARATADPDPQERVAHPQRLPCPRRSSSELPEFVRQVEREAH
jgi:hypothetical protein